MTVKTTLGALLEREIVKAAFPEWVSRADDQILVFTSWERGYYNELTGGAPTEFTINVSIKRDYYDELEYDDDRRDEASVSREFSNDEVVSLLDGLLSSRVPVKVAD